MPGHYLQPLQKTVLPSRHVILDTETQQQRHAGAIEHRYAIGAIQAFEMRAGEDPKIGGEVACLNAELLWAAIASYCRKGHRTVAWAHNLSFDLRISEALRWLPRNGFHLQGIVLERTASWASWTSPEHGSLICCDLYSWLPQPLDRIAQALGVSRETHGLDWYQQATLEQLQARCVEDVQITRRAVQQLLTWLQEQDAGPFRLTGSGQANACWRKRFAAGRTRGGLRTDELRLTPAVTGVWIHGDPNLRSLEREAMWTGRCEAWQHGEIDGPLYEYDMNLAYARIAATHQLPTHLRGEHGPLTLEQIGTIVAAGQAVLAEIEVHNLEEPVAPCRAGERMIWPVGDFQTILWDPELQLLTHTGADIQVKRCWTYHRGPALKPMAEWLIHLLHADDTPGAVRLLAKHWARALIGRMALRYRRWEPYGTMNDLGLALWVGYDENGEPTENLQVGHDRFTLAELTETDQSAPQITGWVMSQCRAQLWDLIQTAGGEHIVYMDTDSLLLNRRVDWGARERYASLELKAQWSRALIHGPRNIELEDTRRLSGIPRTAVRTGPLDYEGTIMRGTKESLLRSELDHVAEITRPYHITPTDPRREHQTAGRTTPYRLGGDQE